MPTAMAHTPTFTVPGSSTNTALVRWNGTGGNNIQDSTILVGATTMGLAADTDLITFGNGTLTIGGTLAATTLTGNGAGVTALAAANITASGTLPALNGAALTALNGSNIASGTVAPARLGSGSPGTGNFLRGDGSWQAAGGDFSNGGDNGALVLGTNDSNSLTLETNNTARMVIAAGGQITKPTQPMFFSALQSHCTNATGDGTVYAVRSSSSPAASWGTSGMGGRQFVVGSCFSGGTFTAPVNGYYLIGANIGVFGTSGSHDYVRILLQTSNGNYPLYTTRMEYHLSGTGQDSVAGGTVLAYMDANDTAYISVTVSGGSKDADLQGHDDNNPTHFWGILVA